MIVAGLFALLQATAPDGALMEEGVWLGRLSTAVAICREYDYTVDESAARAVVDDFEARASLSGWMSSDFQEVYGQGQELERSDMKIQFDLDGLSRSQIQRAYKDLLTATKARCGVHGERYPTVISNVQEGERSVDAHFRSVR